MSDFEKNKINDDEINELASDISESDDTKEDVKSEEEIKGNEDGSVDDVEDKIDDEILVCDTDDGIGSGEITEHDVEDDTAINESESSEPSVFKVWLATRLVKLKKANKKRFILCGILIVAVVTLAVLVFTDIIPILPNSYHRSYVGNQYELGSTQGCEYKSYKNSVIYADNKRVICFDPDMSIRHQTDILLENPRIRTNGLGAIVYSTGDIKALVISGYDKQKVVEFDEKLIDASVTSDAGYTLITEKAGYKSGIKAYDLNNELLYERNTNNDVTDAVISKDKKVLIVSSIETIGNSLCSKISFYDTTHKETVIKEIIVENNLISELYCHDNRVVAIGYNYSVCYNLNGVEIWNVKYPEKELKIYDISDEGNIAFVFNRFNSKQSESVVEIYGFNGKKTGTYESSENIRYISLNNGYCLVTQSGKTVLINNNGKLCKTKENAIGFSKAILYDNYNFGFAVNDRKCEIISVMN